MKYVHSFEVKEEPDNFGTAIIRFREKMEVMSSAPLNGGRSVTDAIFIMQVPHDYACMDYRKDLEAKRLQYGLPEHTVGFMTAAAVKYVFSTADEMCPDGDVFVAVTAGVANCICAGEELTDWEERSARSAEYYRKLSAGTINIIAVSPLSLDEIGKINLFIPVVEGKGMGMHDSGYVETGTTSDAMAIVCPVYGPKATFTGTGTPLGRAVGLGVRKALAECIRKGREHPFGEDSVKMLARDGVTTEHLWECAVALGTNDSLRDMFDETMENMASDPDICSIMTGLLYSAHQGARCAICGQYDFDDMPMNLVDGSMASFLASRISEDRGRDRVVDLMNMSPLSDSELPEYAQMAVYGLVAGVVGYITGFTDE